MSDYVTFEGRIEPLVWGRSTYTILKLPADVVAALGTPKRVEGEIADHPVNLAPSKSPELDGPFLWTGKAFLDAAGLAPGQLVEVRLRATDPDAVETPPDVMVALRMAGRLEAWAALTPGKRRGLLHQVDTAKRAETRVKRVAKLVAAL
ncbi:MAG: YdeI/OmpD-associated family protein [Pseudomonadota bacterium]